MRKICIIALVGASVALAQFGGVKLPKPSDVTNTVKEGANKVSTAVTAVVDAATVTASKTASDAIQSANKTAYLVGQTVIDPGESVGKNVSGNTFELLKDKKVVGRVVVTAGKITATETLASDGKYSAPITVNGPKFIVTNGQITGREILVGGKEVGEEVITAGKVTGNKVKDEARYSLDKHKDIVYKGATKEVCEAAVTSFSKGSKLTLPAIPNMPGLPSLDEFKAAKQLTAAAAKVKTMTNDKAWDLVASTYDVSKSQADEMKKITNEAHGKKLRELFSDVSICSASITDLDKKLSAAGLQPEFAKKKTASLEDFFVRPVMAAGDHFFMTYGLSVGGGAVVGASLGIQAVTDYRGQGGLYISFGPQLVSNLGGGANFIMGFYPKVPVDSFDGWSWALAVSGGKANKIVSGGIEINFDETLNVLQGFGFSVGVGYGKSPVDMSLGGGYSWNVTK